MGYVCMGDMYVWVCMGFSSVIYVIQLSNSLLFRDLDDIK
uniref:Uncharacterized protein n=1 Tax=Picea glauca TaxID=3330 RepID=A0A101LZW5_PICGL|nr:hypothetical protein ABT39_MTgene5283 [Picea glauca]QHR88858.1 hypothetical protein Q903MT_gene2877 [Picea sitchensis]